ncbi:MAG: hypothetical protein RIR41_2957 [Pseudomonadota bacterium]|jgi:hypothetical protein
MKLSIAAAALALAIGTAASAFAAPPTPATTPAAPAAAHATMATPAKALRTDGTIKTVSDTGFTLTSGKTFKLDASAKSSSLKAGQKVKVEYRMRNHERWATEVAPS